MQYLFFVLTFMFLEISYKASTFGALFQSSLIYISLFTIAYATIMYIVTSITKSKIVNRILSYLSIAGVCIVFASQFVYYCIYSSTYSYYSVTRGGVGQALDFVPTIIKIIFRNPAFFLFLLPIIVLIILDIKKVLNFSAMKLKEALIYLVVVLFTYSSVLLMINIDNKGSASNKDIYYSSNNIVMHVNKFGLLTGMKLNLIHANIKVTNRLITLDSSNYDGSAKYTSQNYNILGIDFDKLTKNESDKNIAALNNYFRKSIPTNKNEYTGKFKGKNVIYIMAESFSDAVIDKNLTPTLYKMQQEGINFTNYYTPLYPVSTSDGEYMMATSMLPKLDVWSLLYARNKYLPFTLAHMLAKEGYETLAYHNHSGEYFSRNISIPALGYSKFKDATAIGMSSDYWPESDLEMIEKTYSDYIKGDKPFLTYYITVSGHLQYKLSENDMAVKNWDKVKSLPYSETTKVYLATQIELDSALNELITELEKSGKADDTIIVISGDHYPYGLTLDQLNEISSFEKDPIFDIHKNSLIIWGKNIQSKKVDKLCSNIDVLPTLLNMLGLSYDSRLLIGTDIFSATPSTVILANQSFITDKGKYNSINKTFKVNEGSSVDQEYINKMIEQVNNKFKVSDAILTTDYFSKILK